MELRVSEQDVCDFCSLKPEWRYPAKSFVFEDGSPLPPESVGDWLACDVCAALIESGEWEELAKRGLGTKMIKELILPLLGRTATLETIRRMHQGFRRNRTGRVRLHEGQEEKRA